MVKEIALKNGRIYKLEKKLMITGQEFDIPLQHKYGYIRDERSGVESYAYPVKEGSDILTSTLAACWFSSHPKS